MIRNRDAFLKALGELLPEDAHHFHMSLTFVAQNHGKLEIGLNQNELVVSRITREPVGQLGSTAGIYDIDIKG